MPNKVIATLTLEFMDDSSVNVTGPLSNKMLCYAMLEMARDVVQKHAAAEQARIEVPQMQIVPGH
jgi:hypothetical protein